jgi:predicted Zn-dependent protease
MSRIDDLRELHSEFPQDAFTHYSLALEYANEGQPEVAIAELRQLTSAKPDYIPAHQMLGQTLLRQGKVDEARAALEQGIEAAAKAGNLHAAIEMRGILQEIG